VCILYEWIRASRACISAHVFCVYACGVSVCMCAWAYIRSQKLVSITPLIIALILWMVKKQMNTNVLSNSSKRKETRVSNREITIRNKSGLWRRSNAIKMLLIEIHVSYMCRRSLVTSYRGLPSPLSQTSRPAASQQQPSILETQSCIAQSNFPVLYQIESHRKKLYNIFYMMWKIIPVIR